MAKITFFGGNMPAPITLYRDEQLPPVSITELVREHTLPLFWRCGHGTCGACAIHLTYLNEPTTYPITLTGKEKNVMLRHKLISIELHQAQTIEQNPIIWRLGCHVSLQPKDDLLVTW